jgi:hypothetical protein
VRRGHDFREFCRDHSEVVDGAEAEMRMILRLTRQRRMAQDQVQKLLRAKARGKVINEIDFERQKLIAKQARRRLPDLMSHLFLRLWKFYEEQEKMDRILGPNRRPKDGERANA